MWTFIVVLRILVRVYVVRIHTDARACLLRATECVTTIVPVPREPPCSKVNYNKLDKRELFFSAKLNISFTREAYLLIRLEII